MKDLSLIIISCNTRELLRRCLLSIEESLKDTSFRTETLVVDNNSHDGSVLMVKENFPGVIIIENNANIGFGKANNQASVKASGNYLLFLNSDTEAKKDSIIKLYKFAQAQKDHSIIGGKLFNTDGSPQASCGHFYTLPIVVLSLFLKGDQLRLTRFSPERILSTDWVSGACFIVKHSFFKTLEGFDESIFMYMDEVDLCFRAKKIGGEIIFYPYAHFLHVGSASSSDKRAPYINIFSGLLYFYSKHWPQEKRWLKILLLIKAYIAVLIGSLIFNKSLVINYSKAIALIKNE